MSNRYILLLVFFLLFCFMPLRASAFTHATPEFTAFASELKQHFAKLGWTDLHPERVAWSYYRKTQLKRPLIFSTFGEDDKDIILLLAGVHGDESPSVYVMFRLAEFLKDHPELYRNKKIILAPLVNPDGFFKPTQTRTNASGVDINRNFPTRDWHPGKRNRYYPGPTASSENETKFQIALLNHYRPSRIISVHSPLGCYDYDGPCSNIDAMMVWLKKMSKDSGLPLRRYKVFPGSLGNYAGMERKIHTLTIELPSSAPNQGQISFDRLRKTFISMTELAFLSK